MTFSLVAPGLRVDYSGAMIDPVRLGHTAAHLDGRLQELAKVASRRNYGSDAAALVLPQEKRFDRESTKLARGLSDATALVLIGIGGQNLGPSAVLQAVKGSQYNLDNPDKQVFFADTVDYAKIRRIARVVEGKVARGGKVVLSLSSKSGSTTETMANFRFLLSRLSGYVLRNPEYVVVTSEQGSSLASLSRKSGYSFLMQPPKVGGRYSVLSNAGLFPLSWAGLDTGKLLEGARNMNGECLKRRGLENPAAVLASLSHRHARAGKTIHDSFIFATDFEGAGKWYRQLVAESVGKEFNYAGTVRLRAGFTPTTSIGSTDLHSVGQLYFGGPRDKFFRIVSIKPSVCQPEIPKSM